MTLKHEEKRSQTIAGIFHLGYVALYLVAAVWHFRGSLEHFAEARKKNVDKADRL
jgi:hypothetical protein